MKRFAVVLVLLACGVIYAGTYRYGQDGTDLGQLHSDLEQIHSDLEQIHSDLEDLDLDMRTLQR